MHLDGLALLAGGNAHQSRSALLHVIPRLRSDTQRLRPLVLASLNRVLLEVGAVLRLHLLRHLLPRRLQVLRWSRPAVPTSLRLLATGCIFSVTIASNFLAARSSEATSLFSTSWITQATHSHLQILLHLADGAVEQREHLAAVHLGELAHQLVHRLVLQALSDEDRLLQRRQRHLAQPPREVQSRQLRQQVHDHVVVHQVVRVGRQTRQVVARQEETHLRGRQRRRVLLRRAFRRVRQHQLSVQQAQRQARGEARELEGEERDEAVLEVGDEGRQPAGRRRVGQIGGVERLREREGKGAP